MTSSFYSISDAGLHAWLDASCAYASQIPVEFGTAQRLQAVISAYWSERRGLRLWTPSAREHRSGWFGGFLKGLRHG